MLYLPLLLFIITGLFAGFCAGILGVGGGVIIVPVIFWIFSYLKDPHPMHMAVGTSLAVMIFTSLAATISHARKGSIKWKLFFVLSCGAVIGAFVGPFIAKLISQKELKITFAVLEILVAFYLFFYKSSNPGTFMIKNHFLRILFFLSLGFCVGFIASLLGIGGGAITVPLLLALGYPARKSIGTSAVCVFPVALIGTLTYSFLSADMVNPFGYAHLEATISLAIASIIGAPIGAHFCHRAPEHLLKRIFAGFLVICAALLFI